MGDNVVNKKGYRRITLFTIGKTKTGGITMKYALALAGGGTRGAFQVGVWNALKELGIEISAITGTSIGAVNGAFFASGLDAKTLWENIKASDVAEIDGDNMFSLPSLISALKKMPEGGVDASAFKELLMSGIDEDTVRDSGIDYGLCTYRTDTRKSVELFLDTIPHGKLVDFILASACFPMFKPVTIDGVEYSDGGIRNNIPENMLISRGYDTIISVSVKGVGLIRAIDKCGVNIIDINCRTPEVGIMDFDHDAISESIKSGYFECMRAFGKYSGKYYSIDNNSYKAAQLCYGEDMILGLEEAADMCKIDPYKVYTFKELRDAVLSSYKSNRTLRLMTSAMSKELPGRGVLDSFGRMFRAANAIIYLSGHKTKNE